MPRRERLRRVVLLCCAFMRNLAYYRATFSAAPAGPNGEFWVTTNGNSIDQAVLEWCKLFCGKEERHSWERIVSDRKKFEKELLKRLGMSESEFEDYRVAMRRYRDKFLAHLDSDRVMNIPNLDAAQRAVEFYHEYITAGEATVHDLTGLPATAEDLRTYSQDRDAEARRVFGTRTDTGE
jgi:hypothetical protein